MADVKPASLPSVALLFIKILLSVLFRLVTTPLRRRSHSVAPTLFRDVNYAGIRTLLRHMTIPQARYIYNGTTETYYGQCKQMDQEAKCTTYKGINAYWIGSPDAEVVVLYLHGGGYALAFSPGYMQYFSRLVKDINARLGRKTSISVLVLEYTLVPETIFPTQLQQAATMLQYLIDAKQSSSDIMLTGDSAGGALVLSLLSHILHPRPDVPKVSLSAPLRGIFIYSPWVSFSTSDASYTKNAAKDTLEPSMLRRFASMYIGALVVDNDGPVARVNNDNKYAEALLAEPSWWNGLSGIVEEVLIWVGQDEIFIDAIRKFHEKLKRGWTSGGGKGERLILLEGRKEAHIGPILDVMMGYKEKAESQIGIEEWLMARLAW